MHILAAALAKNQKTMCFLDSNGGYWKVCIPPKDLYKITKTLLAALPQALIYVLSVTVDQMDNAREIFRSKFAKSLDELLDATYKNTNWADLIQFLCALSISFASLGNQAANPSTERMYSWV